MKEISHHFITFRRDIQSMLVQAETSHTCVPLLRSSRCCQHSGRRLRRDQEDRANVFRPEQWRAFGHDRRQTHRSHQHFPHGCSTLRPECYATTRRVLRGTQPSASRGFSRCAFPETANDKTVPLELDRIAGLDSHQRFPCLRCRR